MLDRRSAVEAVASAPEGADAVGVPLGRCGSSAALDGTAAPSGPAPSQATAATTTTPIPTTATASARAAAVAGLRRARPARTGDGGVAADETGGVTAGRAGGGAADVAGGTDVTAIAAGVDGFAVEALVAEVAGGGEAGVGGGGLGAAAGGAAGDVANLVAGATATFSLPSPSVIGSAGRTSRGTTAGSIEIATGVVRVWTPGGRTGTAGGRTTSLGTRFAGA